MSTKNKLGVALFATLAVLSAMVSILLTMFASPLENNIDVEQIIIQKLSSEQINSKFTPVAIYRLDKGSAFSAGSGSLFSGSHGEQIITSEHLFRTEFGNSIFAFRKLRPIELDITRGIHAVLHRGVELAVRPGELPDVVILSAGTPNPIPCYSDRLLIEHEGLVEVNKVNEVITLRSLVSGESVRGVGTLKSPRDAGTQYVLLEYSSIPGESGTGFVDENDRLWVLKGVADWDHEMKPKVERLLGTTRRLSLAYGPLKFRD